LIGFARKIDLLRQYGGQKTVGLVNSPSTYRGPTRDTETPKERQESGDGSGRTAGPTSAETPDFLVIPLL